MREIDDGAQQLLGARVGGHLDDERAVDLDDVGGHVHQVGQRRVAGAEIVDGDAGTERLQVAERALRGGEVIHQRALGELDDQTFGVDLAVHDDVLDTAHEVGVAELAGGHVDRDRRRGGPVHRLPPAQVLAGAIEHPRTEVDDEPTGLRDRDELARRDGPALAPPPQQRLGTGDAARAHRDPRLVVGLELVVLERTRQRVGDRGVLRPPPLALLVEHHQPVAAVLLGLVHGRVRAPQQFVPTHPVAAPGGDPDARGQRELLHADPQGPAQHVQDIPADAHRPLGVGHPLDQDHELVAAEVRNGRLVTHQILQAQSYHPQDVLRRHLPARVVDRLEAVEVDDEDGGRRVPCGQVVEPALERDAVGQTGDGVVERQPLQFTGPDGAVGDVVTVDHDAAHHLVVEHVRQRDLEEGVRRAVAIVRWGRQRQIDDHRPVGRIAAALERLAHPLPVRCRDHVQRQAAQHQRGAITEHVAQRRAVVADDTGSVEHQDHIGAVLDQRPEPLLAAVRHGLGVHPTPGRLGVPGVGGAGAVPYPAPYREGHADRDDQRGDGCD